MFGHAFDAPEPHHRSRPSAACLRRLLGGDTLIAIAALKGREVVGGVAGYELRKFE